MEPARSVRRGSQVLRLSGIVARNIVLLGAVVIILFPFYWMVVSSLKSPAEEGALPPHWIPYHPTLAGFSAVFHLIPFGREILNSLIVALACTVGTVLTSLMAGYVFAKHDFRGKEALFIVVVATMLVPPFVPLVPLYRAMEAAGIINTYLAMILPYLATGFGVFLMRQFIAGVPDELLDAARIDGASEWGILFRVVRPLVWPAVATLALFAFVFQWNNFIWPLTVVHSQSLFTIVLGLNELFSSYQTTLTYENAMMAGAAISIVPSIVLFLFLQRKFVQGIALTGLGG
jgi:multiple sugar transport system permease protein